MNLITLAKKLRRASDIIDDLLGIDRHTIQETPKTAEKIIRHLRNGRNGRLSGRKYKKGTHWTQKPENRGRMLKMLKKNSGGIK